MSGLELNYQIYTLIIIAVVPSVSLAITNGIIFLHARRSTRRIHAMSENTDVRPALSQRDGRLLKHMTFMFVIYFCGWVPMYIIAAVNWNGNAISYVLHHGLTILPVISLLIDVTNLFLYNHELRRYFAVKLRQISNMSRAQES